MSTTEELPADLYDGTLDIDESPFDDLDEYDSDLTSLSSSVKAHVYENGRRYHRFHAGQYMLPNDESEQRQLDLMHHLCNMLLGGRYHIAQLPVNLHRILDIGTGTGVWAINMAEEHPQTQVLGVDLSPIQPSFVPPNCVFEVDNVEEDWMWHHPFDFIHARNIGQGIRDWTRLVQQIYQGLSPGGVVQLVEAEGHFYSDDNTTGEHIKQYNEAFAKSLKLAGMKGVELADLERRLQAAGFTDVRTVHKKVPVGLWPKNPFKKELGKVALAVTHEALRSYSAALFTRHLNMTPEEVEDLCLKAYDEFRNRNVHTYYRYWYVEGRKPEA